jgi:hypothetical protein
MLDGSKYFVTSTFIASVFRIPTEIALETYALAFTNTAWRTIKTHGTNARKKPRG